MSTRSSNVARRAAAGAACSALALITVIPLAAAADDQEEQAEIGPPPEPDGGIPSSRYADSVIHYGADHSVTYYDDSHSVEELGDGDVDADDDVIVLESDILFSPMEWELPAAASARIEELIEEVPEGAAVDVHGHTDSNPVPDGYDFDNDELSENRAQAVADVMEEERPDLTLNVEGFGDSQPAEAEDEDDPSTFAANRRVEIRYGD